MAKGGVLLAVFLMAGCVWGATSALKCLKCGQYNDGVGSITPCTNYTHMPVIDCPSLNHIYCIKYISEGSVIRDCVADCVEKETWSAKTYCCKDDACNSAPRTGKASLEFIACVIASSVTTLIIRTITH